MVENPIRFDDGAAYERRMGVWSRAVGAAFLDWLAPRPGARWLDVGCGNGAFTELIADRCDPAEVHALDASEGQLLFARERLADRGVIFDRGDAMALPFSADRFDVAVMALAISFIPDPGTGVAEMVRVVSPGGTVAAYVWDIMNGGVPHEPIFSELRMIGLAPDLPCSADVSRTRKKLRSQVDGSRPRRHRGTADHRSKDFCQLR